MSSHRDQERKDAIVHGLMSDPDKQIGLSEAITIVGTCQDMCPENERVLRTVRNEVWAEEKDTNQAAAGSSTAEPDEARMVKAFRRSAAGDEVQLPSDLRPPAVLKRTCDYLFNEVIGNAPALEKVHHFVWDRTRAIRNDFSIQQLTKLDDVRIAIDCYERIARFHMSSLHELAGPTKPYAKYDPQQEREQLDRTLLSLMQYYDDTRGRLDLQHEAEFRAYCVILQLRDPTPDLEDRVQSWPSSIAMHYRVRTAVDVYAAACSTIWPEGPIDKTQHVIARQDWDKFWKLVESRKVSFLLACVAETHFMMIREMALSAIVRSARVTKKKDGVSEPNTEWTVDDLDRLFFFDTDEDLENFCARQIGSCEQQETWQNVACNH
ncbi:hypothetical protein M409DRAFT_64043 [Zasmidium cellare ATCC 36951]|uniref:SAC3/GANP/THP3 conserved domain-containing protein n=1 Tax=Zasmidium cellare ATCC 36951 TaxID=1080233 RepID=A0A6A6CV73_ZASCE|nr:uncharacterized protein M409DRAFT_64043 [Zasmidium cellare ATCC 36951]KAF2171077.1 hypothetical protein M409DRAFT_64043 [Zasmidium cellare ATCC 36951]